MQFNKKYEFIYHKGFSNLIGNNLLFLQMITNIKSMKTKTKYLLFAFLLISISSIGQDFEVAPIKLNFRSNPGETETKTLTVKNHANQKMGFTITLRDYLIYKHGETKILPSESTKNSIAKWLTINPSYVQLNPNDEQTVQVTLQAPNDDYTSKWGILSVNTAKEQTAYSSDEDLQTGVNIMGRIDVYITYSPESGQQTRVTISNLREVTTEEDDSRRFAVNIDNIGNKIKRAKVYLIASNLKTAKEKKFKPVTITTYPQSSRTIELPLSSDLPKGRYSLAAILDYGSSSSLEGTQIIINVE